MHYLGAVTMVVSLSDTGYICAVEVVRGIEDKLDKQAVDVMRQQVFQPILLDGKPTAGDMMVQRDFWRADASDTLYSENAGASSSEISLEAKSFPALVFRPSPPPVESRVIPIGTSTSAYLSLP
jgi:hypothetical protein